MAKNKLLGPERQLLNSISRKGLYSLFTYVVWKIGTFFLRTNWGTTDIIMLMVDITFAFLIPALSVNKPELKKLIFTIRKSLSDGKLSREEAFGILRQAWFLILGFWSDLTQTEMDDLPPIPEEIVDDST
jgi:hypothetical protein